jgi:hypothetical protein
VQPRDGTNPGSVTMSQTQPISSPEPEHGSIASAVKRLRELLVPQETLECVAVQRRIFSLTHRRIMAAATSGRLMIMSRELFGGFHISDIRWQDLKEAQLRVGMVGATITVNARSDSDLAVGGQPAGITEIGGLRKDEAQRLYTICQTHEQQWREKRRIRELEELRAKSGGITLGGMPGASMPALDNESPVARLERAREMRDKGLINDSEYEAIKARLVSTL